MEVDNATRDAVREQLIKDVAAHEVCLEGNGKPGLKADILQIQDRIRAATWVLALVGGAIILDVVTRAIAILR